MEKAMVDCIWWISHGVGWGECSYPQKYQCGLNCPKYEKDE